MIKHTFNDQRDAREYPDAHEGHGRIEHNDEAEQQGDGRADGFQVVFFTFLKNLLVVANVFEYATRIFP